MKKRMNETLVIIGAGGHAKVCYEIAKKMNQWTNFIFLDDKLENDSFSIAGPITDYHKYSSSDFFIAIGSNAKRKRWFQKLKKEAINITTLIDPHAVISKSAEIGQGSAVMAGVIVDASATIGDGCILNSGCLIAHDVLI